MISVLLPSRRRLELIRRSITSLTETADRRDSFEVCVAVDPDDEMTALTSIDICRQFSVAVCVDIVPERYGYTRIHEYVNRLTRLASGDWLMLWNDDAIMETQGWDVLTSAYPIGVLAPRSNYASLNMFPIVHKRVIDVMGHFSLSNHCDSWVHDVATAAGCLYPADDISVFHDRFDLTGNNDDEIYRESRFHYDTVNYYSVAMNDLRTIDAEKVRAIL